MFRAWVMRPTVSVTNTTVPGSFLILSQIYWVEHPCVLSVFFSLISCLYVLLRLPKPAHYVVVISRPLCLNPRIEAASFGLRLCLESCICSKVLLPCWWTLNSVSFKQCCGSVIQCLFDAWIRDEKKYGSGSGVRNEHFKSLFHCGSGSGIWDLLDPRTGIREEKTRIRDPGINVNMICSYLFFFSGCISLCWTGWAVWTWCLPLALFSSGNRNRSRF